MNNITHEDLLETLFNEIRSVNKLIGNLEKTGFMYTERWNFIREYVTELLKIQCEVTDDLERYKRTIKK